VSCKCAAARFDACPHVGGSGCLRLYLLLAALLVWKASAQGEVHACTPAHCHCHRTARPAVCLMHCRPLLRSSLAAAAAGAGAAAAAAAAAGLGWPRRSLLTWRCSAASCTARRSRSRAARPAQRQQQQQQRQWLQGRGVWEMAAARVGSSGDGR
jgi:hypothetical protein